jgi:hypothetical protein
MSEIIIERAYTKLVRPLSKKEYGDLKNSIKEHGQLVPITVNQNYVVLDGHNRFKICKELGIVPVVIRKECESGAAERLFVVESNLKRRHLTDIERVELGIQFEPILAELAMKRERATIPEKGQKGFQPVIGSNEHPTGKARDIAADKVGISPTTYHRGKTVLEKGSDEIKEQVKAGKTTISAAYEKVKGRDRKSSSDRRSLKQGETNDILMLPEDQWDATEDTIKEARATHDKQVVLRHNKHQITSVGKQIEISTD